MINNPKNFILSLLNDDGSFRFSNSSSSSNIYSTCFGVLALDLLDELKSLSEKDRTLTIAYIQNKQEEETGLFKDSSTNQSKHGKHDEEYLDFQITDFCIMALAALNEKPLYALQFTGKFNQIGYLKKYLESLNWKDPWLVSNTIMFILNFLIFQNAKKETDFILEWLTENQAKDTGFWHLNNKVDYHNQMAGAYHFVIFYTYLNIPIQHVNKMIDSTLPIQEYDGLFTYAGGGGSCEDLDAIDILCRSQIYSDYKREEIKKALAKAYDAIEKNQNSDEGFCWAKRNTFSLRKILHILNPRLLKLSFTDFKISVIQKLANQYSVLFKQKKLYWKYSGLDSLKIPLSSSDVWSTWFRLLAIATIEIQFPELKRSDIDWNMKQSPGLGYFKKSISKNNSSL